MAIKVLIERKVRPGHEALVWEMLRDLRSQAVRHKGYLYGETWRSLDNPSIFLVASTWGSREHWDAWMADDFRRKVEERMRPLLRTPSTVKVFEEMSTSPSPTPRPGMGSRGAPGPVTEATGPGRET